MQPKSPTETALTNLSVGVYGNSGLPFFKYQESPHYLNAIFRNYFTDQVLMPLVSFRVFQKSTDTALQVSVMGGRVPYGDTKVVYAGTDDPFDLTDDATNYFYLTTDGEVAQNTTGFPIPSVTSHMEMAEVLTASGAIVSIIDRRDTAIFSFDGAASSSLNNMDWQDSVLSEIEFTAAEPSAPTVGDRYINTATGDSSGTTQAVTANYIYQWNGTSWTETVLTEGAWFTVEDTNDIKYYTGSALTTIGTAALLNEAQAFFAATNMTGAQANTLIGGGSAIGLHHHNNMTTVTAATYSIAADDVSILADSTSNNNAITLPDPASGPRQITIKKKVVANSVIIDSMSGNVEGESSITILSAGTSLTFENDGTNWYIV